MKRIFNLFAIAATVALAFSCAKEVNTPDEKTQPAEGAVVFEASASPMTTKTTIEAGSGAQRIVKWAVDDEIAIWWAADGKTTAKASSAGTSTTFSAQVDIAEKYYGVYPSAAATTLSEGVLTLAVPAVQSGAFADANIAVASTTPSDKSFAFSNATALVRLEVSASDYTKAVFRGSKGEVLAGKVPVSFTSSGISLGTVAEPATEVEIPINGAGEYYFAVLPVTLSEGFSVSLYKGSDAAPAAYRTDEYVLGRSVLLNLGSVDSKSITDYFATPAGAGKKNGKDWENALGTAELRALLAQPVDGEGVQVDAEAANKAAILDGATVHMAAGDYYLAGEASGRVKIEFTGADNPVSISFKGGYPAGLSGTSLTGRTDPAGSEAEPANCTAFTGNSEAGILLLGNQTKLSFEGITFKNAAFTGNGGAIRAEAGTSGTSELILSACRFVSNTNDDSHTGAGMYLGKASATIDHCFFGSNYARNGSAISLNAGEGTITISNCLFKGNTTVNTSGAFQNTSPKTVTVSNCTFEGNSAGSWGGGAFHTNDEAATKFVECTFTSNTAPRGGAVSIEKASATFNYCVFSNNVATAGDQSLAGEGQDKTSVSDNVSGGAIALQNAAAAVTINGCTFSGNSAPNGCGGAIGDRANAAIFIAAASVFSGNSAYFHGGAIFSTGILMIGGSSAYITVIEDNKTLATGNQHANGGAIWLSGASSQSVINYVKFSQNEAGQEDGSTVNYSNGGAIAMRNINSFTANNCEFTKNRGRNGGCLNLEPNASSTIKFSDCFFHDNIIRSGADKTGTSGNFHGGVARLGGSGTVTFERCEMKDNYSHNGSGALHINAASVARLIDCVASGNYVENGVGGFATLEYGDIYVEGCTFTGNHVKSGSTVRNGGVFYLDSKATGQEPSLEAKGCTFKDNYIDGSGNAFGAVMRVQGNSDLKFTDCLFEGNHSCYRGALFGLNSKARLKMNNCLVKENYAASGGMIQVGAGSIVYMNRVSFYDNYTTAADGWGVAIHAANTNICMNNVTGYGNHTTNIAPTKCVSFNGDGGWLITNSTIVEDTDHALIRANGTRKLTLCNNILINRKNADYVFAIKSTGIFNDLGHNLVSYTSAPAGGDAGLSGALNPDGLATTDLIAQSDAGLAGSYSELWNSTGKYGVYSWGGSLSSFTPATQSEVETALKEGYPEADSDHSITNVGLDFYNWLESIGALATDGRGAARTAPWWPGSYQN